MGLFRKKNTDAEKLDRYCDFLEMVSICKELERIRPFYFYIIAEIMHDAEKIYRTGIDPSILYFRDPGMLSEISVFRTPYGNLEVIIDTDMKEIIKVR